MVPPVLLMAENCPLRTLIDKVHALGSLVGGRHFHSNTRGSLSQRLFIPIRLGRLSVSLVSMLFGQ
jgi:hypothetical protein